jgi:ankyrin repeat protein
MKASYCGYIEVCKVLIASGADVTRKDETSLATDALLQSAREGHDEICSLLLQHGAPADVRTSRGANCIWLRLHESNDAKASVAHLLSCGISPSAIDSSSGLSSLHIAVQNRQIESARLLIESGADISSRDLHGRTPLHFSSFGSSEMVLALIENGADVHARDRTGRTALHNAARRLNISVINCLVELGSNINAKDASGWGPLMHACSWGESSVDRRGDDTICVIGEILRLGARVNARTSRGLTALHFVCALGRHDSAMQLVASGARLEARTRSGRTPLHLAAIANRINVVRALIGIGVYLDTADAMGCSPLYSAAARGHKTIVQELLARGASVETCNRSGRTALDAAERAGHADVFALLLSTGATFGRNDVANTCSRTPRTLAATRRHGHQESVRLLAPLAAECGEASQERAGGTGAAGNRHGALDKELEEIHGDARLVDQLSSRFVGAAAAHHDKVSAQA